MRGATRPSFVDHQSRGMTHVHALAHVVAPAFYLVKYMTKDVHTWRVEPLNCDEYDELPRLIVEVD